MRNNTSIRSVGAVFWTIAIAFALTFGAGRCFGQSNDVSFPTAITENEIEGQIKARDIGDPRSTTYYFTFNGRQGDLFVNVVTKNLNGSVDIFSAEGMRPFTNILVYADVLQNETGRVIYLRKPEKLILRVQGRSPNDDPAEFQIKFAGGFEAAVPSTDEPPVPKVTDLGETNSGVRVNSVGTIIAAKPKPTPKRPTVETAKIEERPGSKANADNALEKTQTPEKTISDENLPGNEKAPASAVATETKEPTSPNKSATNKRPSRNRNKPAETVPETSTAKSETPDKANVDADVRPVETTAVRTVSKPTRKSPKVVITDTTSKSITSETKPNPLANVNLVILFKDGTKVQRPMTEVSRFTVDQTTLTVLSTNGRTARFSMLEVVSVTIQ